MRWIDDICALAERLISYIRMLLPVILINMLLAHIRGINYPLLSISLSDWLVGCSVFALHALSVIFGSQTKVSRRWFYELPTLKELTAEYDNLKIQTENEKAALAELKSRLTDLRHIRYNYNILERNVLPETKSRTQEKRMER